METIWKYEFDQDINTIRMPKNAKILSIQVQREIPCIWVMVDPDQPGEVRKFEIYGTGHHIEPINGFIRKFIGTFQLNNGLFVFHLFEIIEKSTDIL